MEKRAGKRLAAAMVVGLFASGCSGSFSFSVGGADIETPAGELISGELSEQLGLGEQTPECTIPDSPELGTVFTCTGTLEDGRVINYDGLVTEDDTFTLNSTNTLQPELFEPDFYQQILSDNPGAALSPDGIDCGTGMQVVIDSTFTCNILPDNEGPLTATITMPDTQNGSYEYVIE